MRFDELGKEENVSEHSWKKTRPGDCPLEERAVVVVGEGARLDG